MIHDLDDDDDDDDDDDNDDDDVDNDDPIIPQPRLIHELDDDKVEMEYAEAASLLSVSDEADGPGTKPKIVSSMKV